MSADAEYCLADQSVFDFARSLAFVTSGMGLSLLEGGIDHDMRQGQLLDAKSTTGELQRVRSVNAAFRVRITT
jgi:hypothetical protein